MGVPYSLGSAHAHVNCQWVLLFPAWGQNSQAVRVYFNVLQVAIASHFGRPQPRKQTWEAMQASHSLSVVASALHTRLGSEIFTGLAPDCIGPLAEAKVDALQPGQVWDMVVNDSS